MKRLLWIVLCALCVSRAWAVLPDLELKDVDGNTVHTESLTAAGKPIIISFFATWCKPCMRELQAISEVYADWQQETGVEMYIVSIDQGQDIKKVKPLVDGYGWEYHVLLDPNGEFKRAMNVQNIPHLFVIDKHGKTVYNHTGYTDGSEVEILSKLRGER